MAGATLDELQSADSSLTRSFAACAALFAVRFGWSIFMIQPVPEVPAQPGWGLWLLLGLQVAFYVWYAMSAGGAAKVLGAVGWHYVGWILLAPFLSLVPIPIVAGLVSISPLSIKFLLGGQLQRAIRDGAFAQLHEA